MPEFSTLSEWLAWQETCHPSQIDLGLERVRQVAACMHLTEPSGTVITVAGTNGKGSCVTALEAMLKASGKTSGAYTSPHILTYNERIRINGEVTSDAWIIEAFSAIDKARGEISLTYFEFGTLAAFYCFAKAQCDYWLVEVGLGGRLDATNILDADIAVVTSIGLDHCDWLGNTVEQIALEKAGICRAGKPLVCSESKPPQTLVDKAGELGCPSYWINKDFGVPEGANGCYYVGASRYPVSTSLAAPSVAAALQVMSLLGEGNGQVWQKGLESAQIAGRLQVVKRDNITWVMDVAHNPPAMEFLLKRIESEFGREPWTIVIAMMKDKDTEACIRLLQPYADHWLLPTLSDNPRALNGADMAARLAGVLPGCDARVMGDVKSALQAANSTSQRVLVLGSFYTVAEATQWFMAQARGDNDSLC